MATYKTNRTIPVKDDTKQRVIRLCKKGETFDEFINRVLDLDDGVSLILSPEEAAVLKLHFAEDMPTSKFASTVQDNIEKFVESSPRAKKKYEEEARVK